MIFAAGLGTRLSPYTTNCPKALVKIAGKPLLQRAIEKLRQSGFTEIVINIHHFGEQIIEFLQKNHNFGLDISISDETDGLLDTGGAILKAAPLLSGNESFLVYNVDILSDIDLRLFRKYHEAKGGVATLVVRNRKTERYLTFDDNMVLSGWRNITSGQEIVSRPAQNCNLLAFSGIHYINPQIFNLITESGKFSLINLYLRLAVKHQIFGYSDTSSLWMDLGKANQFEAAEQLIAQTELR